MAKKLFIDKTYFISDYKTSFEDEWNALSEKGQERFIYLATIRIQRLVNKYFENLADLIPVEQDAIKQAVSILIDYWLEYGLNLNRIAGSVSANGFSVSENPPADPDYIPEMVYEALAIVGLYDFAGMAINSCGKEDEDTPDNYKWNGLKYPFKFAYIENSADKFPQSGVAYGTYAYNTVNKHWYVFKNSWEDLGAFTQKGTDGKDGAGFNKVATWNEFNNALTHTENHGKLYFIEDMSGVQDFNNNESVMAYIENGSTYKLYRDWNNIKAYIASQIALLNLPDDVTTIPDAHDFDLTGSETQPVDHQDGHARRVK